MEVKKCGVVGLNSAFLFFPGREGDAAMLSFTSEVLQGQRETHKTKGEGAKCAVHQHLNEGTDAISEMARRNTQPQSPPKCGGWQVSTPNRLWGHESTDLSNIHQSVSLLKPW